MLLFYIFHAKGHPNPLIVCRYLKPEHSLWTPVIGSCQSCLSDATDVMPSWISAIIAGCMMAPTAIGSMMAKSAVTQVLRSLGYRTVLVGITVIIGVLIALFALQSPGMSPWMMILPLFVLGMAMSTQFTAMNTITLADLTNNNASSGNSVLAVTLNNCNISFGVAISAVVLRFYDGLSFGGNVDHFHYTFITMGVVTLLSSMVFLLLKPTDGDNLIQGRNGKKASHNLRRVKFNN